MPEAIMDVLLYGKDFEAAREWAVAYKAKPSIRELLCEKDISFLLERETPDYIQAFQVCITHIDTQCKPICVILETHNLSIQ